MVTDKDDNGNNEPDIYNRLVVFAQDEEGFNAEVENIVEEFIQSQPEDRRERLRAQHWRINQELAKFKDPTARLNRMIEMFYAQLREFQFALTNPSHPAVQKQATDKAPVLEFKKKVT